MSIKRSNTAFMTKSNHANLKQCHFYALINHAHIVRGHKMLFLYHDEKWP